MECANPEDVEQFWNENRLFEYRIMLVQNQLDLKNIDDPIKIFTKQSDFRARPYTA